MAAVGSLTLVYAQQPAGATFPGTPGRIAYSADAGGNYEIYTIWPGGGGKKQLTHNSTGDDGPAYSPDGKRIAYSGGWGYPNHFNIHSEIYTISADGGGKVQLTHNNSEDYGPAYSPNGNRIAYYGYDGHDYEIYTVKVGGGDKIRVTNNTWNDGPPSYKPNGERIAFSAREGGANGIYTIKVNGEGIRRLTNSTYPKVYEPSYSPNGQRIAFTMNTEGWEDTGIFTIDASGGDRHKVTDVRFGVYEYDPDWGSR